MRLRSLLRYAACVAAYYGGAVHAARALRRWRGERRTRVLAYHSFSEDLAYDNMAISPATFLRQVRYLRRVSTTMTLRDWVRARREGTLPRGDVTIVTVDDGYADNRVPLLAALARHSVPSTLFVTVDGDGVRRAPTAVARVLRAVHDAKVDAIRIDEVSPAPMPLRSRREREAAIRAIERTLRPLPAERREAILREVERQCRAGAGDDAMLDWDALRAMSRAGIEIGAHTVTHPVLALCDESDARREIGASIWRVRAETDADAVTFAYPYGAAADVGESGPRICRECGALAAVTLVDGDPAFADDFAIPRMLVTADRVADPWGGYSRAVWACEVEGLLERPRAWLHAMRGVPRVPEGTSCPSA